MLKFKTDWNGVLSQVDKEIIIKKINNELRVQIYGSLPNLKNRLKLYINTKVRNVPETVTDSAKNENINVPKIDEDIIQHLTGLDIKEINATKKSSSTISSGAVVVQRDKWGGPLARVTLDVGPGETMESMFAKAKDFFNKAMFAVPQRDGSVKYLVNNGVDLSQFVKIVCSTDTGVTDNSRARLERFKNVGGTSQWTIKQKAFKEVIDHKNSGFLDITPLMGEIKNGNTKAATKLLEKVKSKSRTESPALERVEAKLKEPVEKTPLSKAQQNVLHYQNLIEIIDTLSVKTTTGKRRTSHRLQCQKPKNFDEIGIDAPKDFLEISQPIMAEWILDSEMHWVEEIKRALKEFTSSHQKNL